jgi:tRNA nucleotidyltransferase (CCA-adding enzyme)
VRAWGPTRAEAFAQAALGALALVVAPDGVAPSETREVRAQGDAPETLLIAWVNECLYVHEIEGFAVRRVEVLSAGDTVVVGLLHGEPLDPRRHQPGTGLRAVTIRRAGVEERAGRHEVSLIVGA